jgi:hypothetical protein
LKKPAGSVRFRFYKQKTEPKPKKPSQTGKTEPNRKKLSQNQKKPSQNRTETGRFDPVSVFFSKKKILVWLFFFNKNRTEPKMITLIKS